MNLWQGKSALFWRALPFGFNTCARQKKIKKNVSKEEGSVGFGGCIYGQAWCSLKMTATDSKMCKYQVLKYKSFKVSRENQYWRSLRAFLTFFRLSFVSVLAQFCLNVDILKLTNFWPIFNQFLFIFTYFLPFFTIFFTNFSTILDISLK